MAIALNYFLNTPQPAEFHAHPAMGYSRAVTVVLVILLAFFTSACAPSGPERTFTDYRNRLENLTQQTPPQLAPLTRPTYPARSALLLQIESPSINWLELWDYRECGLSQLLGERNSILGKHMQPSTHYVMDIRIVQALQYCQQQVTEDELIELTRTLIQQKRQQLPKRYSNATAASREMQATWSYSGQKLWGAEQSIQATADAISSWHNAQQQTPATLPNLTALEQANYVLLQKDAGTLLKTIIFAEQQLRQTNLMLEKARQQKTFCPFGTPTEQLDWARNVMTKFFVGQLQPYLAHINANNLRLNEAFQRFAGGLPEQTQSSLEPFRQQWQSVSHAFTLANKQHVQQWQALFTSCNSSAIKD